MANSNNLESSDSYSVHGWHALKKDRLESIERGLIDLEKGRIHPHKVAKKIYGKYL